MVDRCAGHGLGGHTAEPHSGEFDARAPESSGGQADFRAGHIEELILY
jgi:hypothetical protein